MILVNSEIYDQNKKSIHRVQQYSKVISKDAYYIGDRFYKKIQKSTYLQNRNNKDLNFGLCCFHKTEHFSHWDLLSSPLQNVLTLWREEGLIISVYSVKRRKKVKKTLGKFSSSGKVIKQNQTQRKVYQGWHLSTSIEEVIKKRMKASLEGLMSQ